MKKKRYLCTAVLAGLLLGVHNGYIALWKDGETVPRKVYPYRAEYLPEADRQALERGIRPENDAALQQLLEDYLS